MCVWVCVCVSVYIYIYIYKQNYILNFGCPIGWRCRIHRLPLSRGIRPFPHNECPGYDTKQSDGGVSFILEL